MTKQEFIAAVALEAGVTEKMAQKCMQAFVVTLAEELQKGNEVVIANFGKFRIKTRAEREGVIPGTQEKILIPAKKAVHFAPLKQFKDKFGV